MLGDLREGHHTKTDSPIETHDKDREVLSTPREQSSRHWELLLNDGQRVQYVNNSNIVDLLQDESMKLPDPLTARPTANSPPKPPTSMKAHTDLSGSSSPSLRDIYTLYPDSRLALQLWSIYVKNVDPVLKILHLPTIQSAVISTMVDPRSAGVSMLALTFAIYFAAVTSLGGSHPPELAQEDLGLLLQHYKTALNQILLGADLLHKPELTSLQALAIFVTCLRVHETGRGIWVLNGIAIRLAQSIGLHRDGLSLKLSPFETELRLRLWWHLCLLDSRAPEDHGFELTVDILNPDHQRLPLNVDDSQLCPDMKALPAESQGWTGMSFFLVQIEAARLLYPILGTRENAATDVLSDVAAKRKMIEDHSKWLHKTYFSSAEPSHRLYAVAYQHYMTACKKIEFMLHLREELHHQRTKPTSGPVVPALAPPSFGSACDALASSWTLLSGEVSGQFSWLFKTYTQWYALAYVLRCLCATPASPHSDRAWGLVDDIFSSIGQLNEPSGDATVGSSSDGIWAFLVQLRDQAISMRIPSTSPPSQSRRDNQAGDVNAVEFSQHPDCLSGAASPPCPDIQQQRLESLPDWQQGNPFSNISLTDFPWVPGWHAVITGSLDDYNWDDLM
ncbi:hypothetical protein LTR92_001901 [Exophiala xenobiotica]|nr:hypothetical protein LTR92_001901 [Exophiala xenobiotica]